MLKSCFCFLILFVLLSGSKVSFGQSIPSPKDHFGFNIGDDYQLANFTQTEAYFKKLASTSDRLKLVDIGKTEEGRTQYMLIVSSPENIKNLDKYKSISQRLARAEGLTKEQAKSLADEGKAVVWIDGGLHANETVGIHQLIETAWQLATRKDTETEKILNDVVILMTHANPDGQELVSNWYMRDKDPLKRSLSGVPRLYQKYIGHDNNRDFFMVNMKETQNICNQLFVEWLPQIMYNHHQAGPAGTIVAGAPYRDPFNYVFDPVLMTSLDAVGAAMHNRLNTEGKPGYTQRNGSVFSTWYNGGLRTTTYFHNIIGLLTEIVGSPTPSEIPLVPSRLLPNSDSPNPVTPQKWKFRQSIDYSVSLNYAVLNYAQRYKDELLYNIYLMGNSSIERGNKDTWSFSPKKLEAINNAYAADQKLAVPIGEFSRSVPVKYYDTVMKSRENRDARAYIIPSNGPDVTTAVRFLNALIRTGVQVQQATAEFSVAGKKYEKGTFLVKTDQAFRPHVLDMFEPQDHPNDFKYEGGAPIPPYDAAGWTLAYTMGLRFDRVTEALNGPFKKLPYGELISLPSSRLPSSSGFVLSGSVNESYSAVNDLLKSGIAVERNVRDGSFYVKSTGKAKEILQKASMASGLKVSAAKGRPESYARMAPARIALWDMYGGSMASGWVRWIMEQYHFDATVIYPQEIDNGNLNSKYDVIVFVGGAVPAYQSGVSLISSAVSVRSTGPKPEDVPEEYRNRIGRITVDKSIPQLKAFMDAGGEVVTIGSSTNLAYHLGLPVRNALVEIDEKGEERRLPAEKYYVPGSVLMVDVDNAKQATLGMESKAAVYFDNSPVFKISSSAISSGLIKPLAWFGSSAPLKSGWAWGQTYLRDGIAAFEAKQGKGKLFAFGPEITFRAQTHGTFKLLFNQLYLN
ncbi:MAG: peptidase [Pedobacter sp.]|nr:MAG: peptidase [Pedobacter sp.]